LPSPNHDRDADRRLRIGYVSPDLRDHVVGRFMLPLLANHDHQRFEIFCYADVARADAMTERLRSHADCWRNTAGLSDEQLARAVRDDRIDILIDLTMHMAGSRLLAFARKPAPVQVTYLAYCGTTGLEAMDYRLTDPHLDPPDATDEYVEQSIRLPRTYWCYQPPDDAPEVSSLPMTRAGGRVTFGCLNNFSKVSQPTIETWAELLRAIPDARLILHAHAGAHRQRLLTRLGELGIDTGRIEFVGFAPTASYLATYHRIDVALDPFPYAGGTTTCDALWMGVPVVTLAGRTAVGRGGASILTNLGLPELVARSPEEYVQIALALARAPQRLERLRCSMRDRMGRSPITDAPGFACDVESAYRAMWARHCDQS
jgi:predicted O-linked N-acetylglucosamine transferase (SPINDLY family)